MRDLAAPDPPHAATPAEVLQGALIDSRHRWRELITLAADVAFETDEWGRFSLIVPDPALGWAADSLVGLPSSTLLTEGAGAVFNPFRVSARVRHRQAWLRRGDGGVACVTFHAAPILDASGRVIGARGVGIDMTETDKQAGHVAAALRRAEVLDHILRRMGQEVLVPRMMAAILAALANAMGAEGTAVIRAPGATANARLWHASGAGADAILTAAAAQLERGEAGPAQTMSDDGRPILTAPCQMRQGERAGLAAWRAPGGRAWDDDDSQLIGAAVTIVRTALEQEETQWEMARQARTDPLTGLLNRRAFLEELERHAARQDREHLPSTLIFADLDHFKPVNDRLGHDAGDEVLRRTAVLLRNTFRPGDLIARLGGDEFAIWLDSADHMTAAERAEHLRDAVPRELSEITGADLPLVTLSIGIASRDPGEPLDNLMRRADMAMYEVKRGGRGHWRVSLRKRPRMAHDEAARVRLGARATSTPDELRALAADDSVTVRAALALNTATPRETDAVLARDSDERVRALLARKLAALAPTLSVGARTRLQQQTYDTLTALVGDEAVRVRVAIAEVVKDLPAVPADIITRLARDEAPPVCEPVIRFSPLLTVDDLIALVADAPSTGTRLAVARRAAIDASVSDALAAGGTEDVLLALLMNGSAQIREATLDALVARSVDHPAWHAPLIQRPKLSAESIRTLARIVADHLVEDLAARGDLDGSTAADLRTRVAARMRKAPERPAQTAPVEKPTEEDLLAAARDGDARRAAVMLSVASGMPLPVVRRAATLRSAKGLVSLAWKAGFSMKAGYAMQVLLARLSPGVAIKPGPGGSFPLSVQEMCWQLDFLGGEGADR